MSNLIFITNDISQQILYISPEIPNFKEVLKTNKDILSEILLCKEKKHIFPIHTTKNKTNYIETEIPYKHSKIEFLYNLINVMINQAYFYQTCIISHFIEIQNNTQILNKKEILKFQLTFTNLKEKIYEHLLQLRKMLKTKSKDYVSTLKINEEKYEEFKYILNMFAI